METDAVVIVAARRTPLGAFQGALAGASATGLGSAVIKAAIEDARIRPGDIDEVLMGCVLPAGLGQAPARQAALGAGVPESTGCTTVNKVCGSGMKTAMLGTDLIRAGSAGIVVAGGMESMSNAPYLLPKVRAGWRMGHQQALDHMFWDGLTNPYDGHMMGHFAEQTAAKYGFTREDQDAFAIESVTRAKKSATDGTFRDEIVPVTVSDRRGETTVDTDEEPGRVNIERIPSLPPAFSKDGTVTAASSSSISDGAAAVILMSAAEARARDLEPLARVAGHAGFAHEPAWFTTAPVSAIRALHDKLGWTERDVDLYEINEAFACVTMAAIKDLGLTHERVNVHGGACALGHPIGATGARLIVTLLHAMRAHEARRGIASLCLGGGEAVAIGLERP